MTGAALAGGFAVVVLLLGVWLSSPMPESDVADITTTTPIVEVTAPPLPDAPPPEAPGPDRELPQNTGGPETVAAPPSEPGPAAPDEGVVDPESEPVPEKDPPTEEPVVPVDTTPPDLVITSPADGSTVKDRVVLFTGTSEPGARVNAGRFKAEVKDDGRWSIKLTVREGPNGARFTATDEAGNQTTRRITVYYEPVKDEEPKDPPPEIEFTARSTYGSCSFVPPYDVYFGTGEPGTKIIITSEFGGGSTTVDEEGHWETKVFFVEAPIGETFLVTVKDRHGTKKKFEFTALEPE